MPGPRRISTWRLRRRRQPRPPIFSLPGIGRYFVNGALNRDYTLVMGVVIVYATLVIVMNLISDLLYAVLDPRVRLDR